MGQIQNDAVEQTGVSNFFEDLLEPCEEGYTNEVSEYNRMKRSVFVYGGFYVGRYEAGIEGTAERISGSGTADKAVIKQGKNVYNWIGWSNSSDMKVETGGAFQKAKDFAGENNYTSVTSTLIYGIEWDAIMQWIDPEYKNGNCNIQTSFVANSTGKGNYVEKDILGYGILAKTGSSSEYAVKNIYDLAGNVGEWTMETYSTYTRVFRGRLLLCFWFY